MDLLRLKYGIAYCSSNAVVLVSRDTKPGSPINTSTAVAVGEDLSHAPYPTRAA